MDRVYLRGKVIVSSASSRNQNDGKLQTVVLANKRRDAAKQEVISTGLYGKQRLYLIVCIQRKLRDCACLTISYVARPMNITSHASQPRPGASDAGEAVEGARRSSAAPPA